MWPSGIKDDVLSAEDVFSTVGETFNGAEREGETDKAGRTKAETAETHGTIPALLPPTGGNNSLS